MKKTNNYSRKRGWMFLFLLILVSQYGFAQDKTLQKKGIDDLKKLSRKELIDRAVKHINDPEFKAAHYDRIKVMANATKMYVIFDISARYVPVLTSYYVPVYVDMVNQKVTIKEVSNSGFFSTIFYDNPKLYEKQVKSIIENINKSGDTTLLPQRKLTEDRTLNIREVYGHFEVEIESEEKVSTFDVDKVSGKLSNIHHTILPAKKENAFTEIK